MEKGKKIIHYFCIITGAIVFSLIILEVGIRIFYRSTTLQAYHSQFMQYDALLGWKKIPKVTGKYVTTEYSITEKINSKGIRGPEYSYEKRNDEYRILILGDSFAEGYSVEFPEVFSEVLKMRLNKSHGTKHYEVINAGTAGYGTDQELLLFQAEGKKYHPDLTILMFHDNDFWYNNQARYWRGDKPLFQLDNHNTLRLTNIPLPKPVPINNKAVSSSPAHENSSFWKYPFSYIKNSLSQHSKLYRLVHDRLNNMPLMEKLFHKLKSPMDYSHSEKINRYRQIPAEFKIYYKQYTPELSTALKITEALLVQLKQETASCGSDFIIFYVPTQMSVYSDMWDTFKNQYNLSNNAMSLKITRTNLLTICSNYTISCLDPLEAFKTEASKQSPSDKRLYFHLDGHWTPAGHNLAGELLATYLLSRKSP